MRMSVWRAELVGMGALTGRNVYLVEGEPAECAGFNGGRIELAIDTETLFVLRHAVYAFETDELVRLDEVISVEYDVALDDSVFAPPPERQIEDVSDRGSGRVFMGHDGDEADCY
jgi:hypothetical protein